MEYETSCTAIVQLLISFVAVIALLFFCEASCWSDSVAWATCRWEACIWDACSCWLCMTFVAGLGKVGILLRWVQDANDI